MAMNEIVAAVQTPLGLLTVLALVSWRVLVVYKDKATIKDSGLIIRGVLLVMLLIIIAAVIIIIRG